MSAAPHQRLNEREQRDRSMRLAAILMRPDKAFGPNTDVSLGDLFEARRRMVEARWLDALPGLDVVIGWGAALDEERRQVDDAIASGRAIDERLLRELFNLAKLPFVFARNVKTSLRPDHNGNFYVVAHWDTPRDSPFRVVALPVYRELLARIHGGDGLLERLRDWGSIVWSHMTAEERAEFSAAGETH